MSTDGETEYRAELGDIKQNVKNLGDCLQAVLKRIEELEYKPVGKAVSAGGGQQVVAANGDEADTKKQVQVKESEHVEEDGTHVKRLHITERVVTTKTFQTLPSPDCEFKAPPYNDSGLPVAPANMRTSGPCVVGYRRKKHDEHLVSQQYGARLCRLAQSEPGNSAALLLQGLGTHAENGQLIIDEIKKDSAIGKTGLLHVGDNIVELNGKEVQTCDQLESAWKNAGDTVTLKIVPAHPEQPSPDARYVKALYDYSAKDDKDHPCADIGLSFKAGDVLQVVSCDDSSWWQARKVNDLSRIGYIPSKKLEEQRNGHSDSPSIMGKVGSLFGKRRKDDDGGKPLDTPYEEVAKLSPYGRRVLVLLGAPGVGRRTLKSMLLAHDPNNFATVTPCWSHGGNNADTSRAQRDGEQEGREYHFVKRDAIQKEVDRGHYVEWGEYNGNLYGTSVASVRDVIRTGRVCVLDCSPQAARYLYTKEFMPYVVFIAPPSFEELKQLYQVHPNRTKTKTDEDLKKTCDESGKLEAQYKNLVDNCLVNRNVDVTFRRLVDALESLKTETQWVPANWIYQ